MEEKNTRTTKADIVEETLTRRIDKLEALIAKLCHYAGRDNMLNEFGIDKWVPGKDDMNRWKE